MKIIRNDVFSVMFKAGKEFNRQMVAFQTLETKIECIKQEAIKLYDDPTRVWYDILTEAKRLTNSAEFNDYCKSFNLIPSNVAQHIVFEGKMVIKDILLSSVKDVMGERVRMFVKPLYDPEKTKNLLPINTEEQPNDSGTVTENESNESTEE